MTKLHPKNPVWLAVFICLFFAPSVLADEQHLKSLEDRLAQSPTLSDMTEYAYQSNPMIKAAREGWRESLERYRVNTAYPDPLITMTYRPKAVANDLNAMKIEAMLSQTIPFPGKLSAAGRAVRAEASFRRTELDKAVRDVVVGIRESFHELSYIREAQRISSQNQELLNQIRTIGETAYAKNRAALIEVMKAQSQAAQNGYDNLLLRELEKTETTRLNSLLNRPGEAAIGALATEPPSPVAYSLDEIFAMSEKNREEIKMSGAEIRKSEAEADMARFENYPEFMVGVIYESDATEDPQASRTNMWGIQIGLTLPIWADKNSGRLGAARALAEKAKAMATAQVNDTRAMVRETYFRLKNAERLMTLYRDRLIPQAAKSVEIADTWNRQGQGSLTDYIETQSVWYNFQLAQSRSQADYGKYLARLEGLAGQSLTVRDQPPKEKQP